MAQANWTRKIDWSLTSLLCSLSGVVGIAVGIGMAAWTDLSLVTSSDQTAASTIIPTVEKPLQSFFPDLESVEATFEQVKVQEIVRREAGRQQQLNQSREALAFNGATTEDIEAFIIQKLVAEAAQKKKEVWHP